MWEYPLFLVSRTMRVWRKLMSRIFTAIAGALLLSGAAHAESSLQAHAFSEPVQRGASLTDGHAAVGLSYDYNFDAGMFTTASAYYADGTPSAASLTRNVRAAVGWFSELGDDRAIEASVSFSEFLDIDDWSYAEARVDYLLGEDASLSLAWSPDYFGRNAANTIIGGDWRPAFVSNSYFVLSGGGGYLAGPFDVTYLWGEVGVGFASGRFDVKATINLMGSDAADILVRPDSTVAVQLNVLIF